MVTTMLFSGDTSTTTGSIWPAWNATYSTNTASLTTTTTAITDKVWVIWSNNHIANTAAGLTAGITTTSTSVRVYDAGTSATTSWGAWNDEWVSRTIGNLPHIPVRVSEEERRRREEENARWQQRCEEETRLRKAAEEKAERLLLALLSEKQREEYKQKGHFYVEIPDAVKGKRVFKINKAWAGNIEEIDERGLRLSRYCVHPRERIPVADSLLAQKLFLETDPQALLKIANRSN